MISIAGVSRVEKCPDPPHTHSTPNNCKDFNTNIYLIKLSDFPPLESSGVGKEKSGRSEVIVARRSDFFR